MLITFLFNKNVGLFLNLNLYEFNLLTIILYIVIVYYTYIKFSILVRVLSLFNSIKFFYLNIKNKQKNIKSIAIYYYFFNLLFIIISILFVFNIYYNLNYINILHYPDYTNILSCILFLVHIKIINDKEFKITENNFNPLLILLYLLIIFIPLIGLNFYSDKITIFLENNIYKRFIIHCDTIIPDKDLEKLKNLNKSSEVITQKNNSVLTGQNKSNVINSNCQTENIYINNTKEIDKNFYSYFIKEYSLNKISCSNELYNLFMSEPSIKYNLNDDLVNFLNEHIELISKIKSNKKFIIECTDKIYILYTEYLDKINYEKVEYNLNSLVYKKPKNYDFDFRASYQKLLKIEEDYLKNSKDINIIYKREVLELIYEYDNKNIFIDTLKKKNTLFNTLLNKEDSHKYRYKIFDQVNILCRDESINNIFNDIFNKYSLLDKEESVENFLNNYLKNNSRFNLNKEAPFNNTLLSKEAGFNNNNKSNLSIEAPKENVKKDEDLEKFKELFYNSNKKNISNFSLQSTNTYKSIKKN